MCVIHDICIQYFITKRHRSALPVNSIILTFISAFEGRNFHSSAIPTLCYPDMHALCRTQRGIIYGCTFILCDVPYNVYIVYVLHLAFLHGVHAKHCVGKGKRFSSELITQPLLDQVGQTSECAPVVECCARTVSVAGVGRLVRVVIFTDMAVWRHCDSMEAFSCFVMVLRAARTSGTWSYSCSDQCELGHCPQM